MRRIRRMYCCRCCSRECAHFPIASAYASRATHTPLMARAMWLESDCNLVSGEALAGHILYGGRFLREEFGRDYDVLWLIRGLRLSCRAAADHTSHRAAHIHDDQAELEWNEPSSYSHLLPIHTTHYKTRALHQQHMQTASYAPRAAHLQPPALLHTHLDRVVAGGTVRERGSHGRRLHVAVAINRPHRDDVRACSGRPRQLPQHPR